MYALRTYFSILRNDIQFIRVLNSRLYSFLQARKSHTSSAGHGTNLVVTIPPDLTLSDSERSILAEGLNFVPRPGSFDFFYLKQIPNLFQTTASESTFSQLILGPSQGRF
jgi:hypothetical protein